MTLWKTQRSAALIASLFLLVVATPTAAKSSLTIEVAPEGGRLEGRAKEGQRTVLEASSKAPLWAPVKVMDETRFSYPLAAVWPGGGSGFFRLRSAVPPVIPAHPSWKTEIDLTSDSFLSEAFALGDRNLKYVKFTVLVDDPTTVYFQDSAAYEFHYEFAVDRMPIFAEYSREEFNAVALRREGRQAVLGSVVVDEARGEFTIEFEGSDIAPARFVEFYYKLVESSLGGREAMKGSLKTGRANLSLEEIAYLKGRGIELAFADSWAANDVCYTLGWALGRLVYMDSERIESAYEQGELRASDILVTDALPDEIPYLAGVVTLSPTTPQSHVAILTRAFGSPLVYLSDPEQVADLLELEGEEVILAVNRHCRPYFTTLEAANADAETVSYLRGLKAIKPLEVVGKQRLGAYSSDVEHLTPADAARFGGKAANFGFLLREIPDGTRPFAVAFSFDLWDDFLSQEIEDGVALGAWIRDTLSGYSWSHLDLPSLKADLKRIRDRIEEAEFSPQLREATLAALEPFDPGTRIRFRSSTNVEDAENYSGAGLYESKSGCLADELDDDEEGPSLCEPDEEDERGVFRAMRKVYASFYNTNAFLERLRLGVDEARVGMGLLAHYSYPDEIEMANGVMVYDESVYPWERLSIVSQLGAESVANPSPESQPEVARVGSSGVRLIQRSNRLSDDATWILVDEERYAQLYEMVLSLAQAYRAFHSDIPADEAIALDFEYKLVAPGRLEIKQIRRVPTSEASPDRAAFIGGSRQVSISSSEGEVLAAMSSHYLKSEFALQMRSRRLDRPESRSKPLIQSVAWTRVRGSAIETFEGDLLELPEASYEYRDGVGYYRWSDTVEGERIEYTLEHYITLIGPGLEDALAFAPQGHFLLTAVFERPRFADLPVERRKEFALYAQNPQEQVFWDFAKREVFQFESADGVSVTTDYWRVSQNTPNYIVKTGLLLRWNTTRLVGLTDQAIELRSPFSQSQAQAHHNWGVSFVFEPRLEPGLPGSILDQLEAMNVRQIVAQPGSILGYIGLDGEFREAL